MFDSNQFFGVSAEGAFYPKTIDQSLRFEDGDNPSLTFSASAADSTKTWTFSGWVKRGNLGVATTIFSANIGGNTNETQIRFETTNKIVIYNYYGGGYKLNISTNAVFRDPSAWYHIVVKVDTTQATNTDGVKIYVNGVNQDLTYTTYTQNSDFQMTTSGTGKIGNNHLNDEFDGYLAEVHFTDGTAYTADDFGELKSGIWIPKDVSVTYGTNGFYLDFADGAAIGDDESGNGNDFTANNLVASDVVLDSPTNNFCTINPLHRGTATPLSEGNLRNDFTSNAWRGNAGTFGIESGKWYWEVTGTTSGGQYFGLWTGKTFGGRNTASVITRPGEDTNTNKGFSYIDTGSLQVEGTNVSSYTSGWADGDIVGFALDADNDALYIYVNGALLHTEDLTDINSTYDLSGDKPYFVGSGAINAGQFHIWNFGQDSTFAGTKTVGGNSDANGIGDFAYAPPSGYLALCTDNLPDPAIDPAQDATPEDYMNVALWTGNGSTQSIDVGHATDFVWIKTRNASVDHRNYDSVRGVNTALRSNTNGAEAVETTSLTSFDSTGFSLGNYAGVNNSGSTYVGWSWKAGTSVSGSTTGSGTSKSYTGSVNTDAGFSIIGYEGNGTTGHEIPHHLDSTPEFVIIKNRDSALFWNVQLEAGKHLYLNDSREEIANSDRITAFGSSTLTLGNNTAVNTDTENHIMYCFHSVDGFSKVGYARGSTLADGHVVWCGFRPKYLLIKQVTSDGYEWVILDSTRSPSNGLIDDYLFADLANAEASSSTYRVDFLATGFQLVGTANNINDLGKDYIFYAVADQPFKYANAK